eukprot:GHUV01054297.1.p1 GENE.GHUV01054297.1~~GHUV01054297.1.p1  ORF type:complete len:131 (-),score=1.26 GHUV01054297.1:55-447(-)
MQTKYPSGHPAVDCASQPRPQHPVYCILACMLPFKLIYNASKTLCASPTHRLISVVKVRSKQVCECLHEVTLSCTLIREVLELPWLTLSKQERFHSLLLIELTLLLSAHKHRVAITKRALENVAYTLLHW